jgi:hypothetical protein
MEADTEVDLASYAYQIWANATKNDPVLAKKIADLPDVVYSSRYYEGSVQRPQGVLTYMKTADGTDSLAWVNENGESITQSHLTICGRRMPAEYIAQMHSSSTSQLVLKSVELMKQENLKRRALGRPNSARRHVYERWILLKYLKRTEPMFIHGI